MRSMVEGACNRKAAFGARSPLHRPSGGPRPPLRGGGGLAMHKPPRMLIVDDNETNRDILRTRLGKQGDELMEAADGEEAIASARQHQPDLILLDVMMPKVDGIEACRRLKA